MLLSSEPKKWRDEIGDYALVPVPRGEKRSFLNVFLVYSGVLAVFAFIASGTAVGLRYDVQEIFIIAFVASIILIVIGSGMAYIGGLTNLSTYISLRYPFGYLGSWVWGTIISGFPSGIGWFAFETWLFGTTIHTIVPNASWANVGIAAIWGGLLMMLTAYYGYGGLSALSYLAVPMFFVIAIVGIMYGFSSAHSLANLLALQPKNPAAGIGFGVTTVVGSYIVGAIISMDVGRFAPKSWHPAAAWGIQIALFMPLLITGAGILTLTTGESNFVNGMLAAGLGVGVFLMALFGFWSTNDNNLYSGALSWSLFLPLKKKNIVVIEGIIGTAIAAYVGFSSGTSLDAFTAFLGVLGRIIPAVAGVVLGDFYVYRWLKGKSVDERYNYTPDMEYGLVVWPGWVAGILGAWLGGWVISIGLQSLNALVLGGVIHVILMWITDALDVPNYLGTTQIDETGRSPTIHRGILSQNDEKSEKTAD